MSTPITGISIKVTVKLWSNDHLSCKPPLLFVTIIRCSQGSFAEPPNVKSGPAFVLPTVYLEFTQEHRTSAQEDPLQFHLTPTPPAPHFLFHLPLSSSKSARVGKTPFQIGLLPWGNSGRTLKYTFFVWSLKNYGKAAAPGQPWCALQGAKPAEERQLTYYLSGGSRSTQQPLLHPPCHTSSSAHLGDGAVFTCLLHAWQMLRSNWIPTASLISALGSLKNPKLYRVAYIL